MKSVSVIIPCYNGSEYIAQCLDVLIKDKLSEKEIIVIDDGSTDNSVELLKEYEKKYECIKIITQENGGQAKARNNGIKIATGKYIMFVDIDDRVEKNILYLMYNYAEKNKSDYVFCDYFNHELSGDTLVSNFHSEDPKKNAILANFAPWGKLISRDLIDKCRFNFLEGKIYEDVAVIPIIASLSKNPKHLTKALYFYNMTNQSTMRQKKFNKKYRDMMYVSDYLFDSYLKNGLSPIYEDEFKFIFLDSILKSGVLVFARYKQTIKDIKVLRKNVRNKFNKITDNVYYKNESKYVKFITFLSLHCPAVLLYIIKGLKK